MMNWCIIVSKSLVTQKHYLAAEIGSIFLAQSIVYFTIS